MRPKQPVPKVVAMLAVATLLAGCGADPEEEAPGTSSDEQTETTTSEGNVTETDTSMVISITGLSFPDEVQVPGAKSVTWVNNSSAPHEVQMDTLDGNQVDMDPLRIGVDEQGDFSLETGAWAYFCVIHPSMTGTLVVGA